MKINKMTDYAFRILHAIYIDEDSIVTCNMIAQREQISKGVVMKVITALRTNGLVKSHQGRGRISGGYSLMCSLEKITCLDIIEIMEGPIRLDVRGEDEGASGSLRINNELQRIEETLRKEMGRKSIADIICPKQRRKAV